MLPTRILDVASRTFSLTTPLSKEDDDDGVGEGKRALTAETLRTA